MLCFQLKEKLALLNHTLLIKLIANLQNKLKEAGHVPGVTLRNVYVASCVIPSKI